MDLMSKENWTKLVWNIKIKNKISTYTEKKIYIYNYTN